MKAPRFFHMGSGPFFLGVRFLPVLPSLFGFGCWQGKVTSLHVGWRLLERGLYGIRGDLWPHAPSPEPGGTVTALSHFFDLEELGVFKDNPGCSYSLRSR